MSNRNHFDKVTALNSAVIGFEFEFFSNMLKGAMKNSLSEAVGKTVILSDKYHSKTAVSKNTFKLEPDYSGGSKMFEFITGPLPYSEAIPIFYKIIRWIEKNAYTTDACAFQFSVSFSKFDPSLKIRLENIDRLKFLLGFDETKIYSKFGNRTNNVYSKSIKRVIPRNRFSFVENIRNIDSKMFKIPEDKYYGVNFSKLSKGYLEIRYIGGKDYHKKAKDIREIMDYVCLYMYDILSGRILGYTADDTKKLEAMMKDYKNVVRSFSRPNSFAMYYPDFHLLVDLKGDEENIKTYYTIMRDKIFDLIVDGNMKRGFLNYDTSTGRFQVKNAKIRDAFDINGFDIIDCDIKNSVINNCAFYSCKIRNSEIIESQLMGGNLVKKSKIKNTSAEFSNQLIDCFIDSKGKKIDCEIEGGVLRAGNTAQNAKISKETETVKGWSEKRNARFVTDSRLKNSNADTKEFPFKNQN